MHDAKHIANLFIEQAQKQEHPVTHLQVQKLVYYAHAWMIGFYDRPMIADEIEVWKYGPVVPAIYYSLSHNRGNEIVTTIPVHPSDERELDKREKAIFDAVYEKYGSLSGLRLSTLTHASGTPWHKARERGKTYIENAEMRKYYGKLAKTA